LQDLKEIRGNMSGDFETIKDYLGEEADYLLNFNEPKLRKESIHIPGPDFVDRIFMDSDR
jgi:class I fructose-bisphosphate aldolase